MSPGATTAHTSGLSAVLIMMGLEIVSLRMKDDGRGRRNPPRRRCASLLRFVINPGSGGDVSRSSDSQQRDTHRQRRPSQHSHDGVFHQPDSRHADDDKSQRGPDVGQQCAFVRQLGPLPSQPVENQLVRSVRHEEPRILAGTIPNRPGSSTALARSPVQAGRACCGKNHPLLTGERQRCKISYPLARGRTWIRGSPERSHQAEPFRYPMTPPWPTMAMGAFVCLGTSPR